MDEEEPSTSTSTPKILSKADKKKEQNRLRQLKYREKLKANPVKKQQHLEKERIRDLKRRDAPKTRGQKTRTKDKTKLRVRNHRKRIRDRENADELLKKRNGLNKRKSTLKRKNKQINELQRQVEELESQLSGMEESSRKAAKTLLGSLTPRSKRGVKSKFKTRTCLRVLGVRLRRNRAQKHLFQGISTPEPEHDTGNIPAPSEDVKALIIQFAENNSVAIPDIKKMKVVKKDGVKEKVPVRFRRETLKVLHLKFLAENPENEVSFSYFSKNFPTDTVVIPSAEDWGTAGCAKCLNPRFKVEELRRLGCTSMTSEEMSERMTLTTSSTNNSPVWNLHLDKALPDQVTYCKWVKVNAEGSSVPIDRKVEFTKTSPLFLAELIRELRALKEHTSTIKSQFREVKRVKECLKSDAEMAIIHMDWSTNLAIKQARATQGHFFFNKQVSLHPMVLWHQGGSSSICTFSDCLDHKAAATWAGISSLLDNVLCEGYRSMVFISDSPTKQYRNRLTITQFYNI